MVLCLYLIFDKNHIYFNFKGLSLYKVNFQLLWLMLLLGRCIATVTSFSGC